jgi:pimeloyl-ACP methyl ester carboxylesterase
MWGFVEALSCPTLLVRGGRSTVLDREVAERMTAVNPRIRLVEIPDATHWVHDDSLDAFVQAVDGFLDPARSV